MILVVEGKCSHYSCVLYTKGHAPRVRIFSPFCNYCPVYNCGLQEDVIVYLDIWTGRQLLKATHAFSTFPSADKTSLLPVTPREEKLRARIDIMGMFVDGGIGGGRSESSTRK